MEGGGREGGAGPPTGRAIVRGRPGEGHLQDGTLGCALIGVLWCLSLSFCCSALYFFGEGIAGKANGLPHLDGRTPPMRGNVVWGQDWRLG